MVGVAVAMAISTMNYKSCMDLHKAQGFDKKFSAMHVLHNWPHFVFEIWLISLKIIDV